MSPPNEPHPLDLEDFLESIIQKLGELGGSFLEEPSIDMDWGEVIGTLEVSIVFPTGHRLEVILTSAGPEYFPTWLDYSFHFMDDSDTCVFRYDASPHHQGPHFPHHKHEGPEEKAIHLPQPSLEQIMEDVRQVVYP